MCFVQMMTKLCKSKFMLKINIYIYIYNGSSTQSLLINFPYMQIFRLAKKYNGNHQNPILVFHNDLCNTVKKSLRNMHFPIMFILYLIILLVHLIKALAKY